MSHIDDVFVQDYRGVAIYKNSAYNKWLDNGKYVAQVTVHIKVSCDSLAFIKKRIKEKQERLEIRKKDAK